MRNISYEVEDRTYILKVKFKMQNMISNSYFKYLCMSLRYHIVNRYATAKKMFENCLCNISDKVADSVAGTFQGVRLVVARRSHY